MTLTGNGPHTFTLTSFASGFPSVSSIGPIGVALVPGATQNDNRVLVSDWAGSRMYTFPSHADGQVVGGPGVSLNSVNGPGDDRTDGLAQLIVGGTWKYYMTQQTPGFVVEVDGAGTPVPGGTIATIGGAIGIAPFPSQIVRAGFSGRLFVTDGGFGHIWNVDPIAKTKTLFTTPGTTVDGLSFSQNGNVLYVAAISSGVVRGYDTSNGNLIWTSPVKSSGPDGISTGMGSLTGFIYVNYNNGDVWEFGEPGGLHAGEEYKIATGGTRGDFIATDTNVFCPAGFPSMLLTQTSEVLRLCSAGGGFFGPPTSDTRATCGANGTACEDGNPCTQAETCQSGVCVGGGPVSNGTACNDGNVCTQTETCQSGVCSGSAAANGTACNSGNPCTNEACQSGVCVAAGSAPNGTACNDGNICTSPDACQSGTCVGSGSASNGTPCNDGNACTPTDACQSGACVGSGNSCASSVPGLSTTGIAVLMLLMAAGLAAWTIRRTTT